MPIRHLLDLEDPDLGYDDAVSSATLPDRFCTGSPWVISAHEAFTEGASTRVHQFDEGFVPLAERVTALGATWMPLEASWGLAAPLVGPDLDALAARLAELVQQGPRTWDALFLSGLVRGGPDFSALVRRLGRRFRLGLGTPTVRCVASIEGGMEGFLARRTPAFRKNLRRLQRAVEGRLSVEFLSPTSEGEALAAYDEIQRIEVKSWKAREGHGIAEGPMRTFYARMVPRLARRGELRVTFARIDGEPAGYVLGGLRGTEYRGLQISFDDTHRVLSLGHLMQAATVRRLTEEGVMRYDLGTDMAYKRVWAELEVETLPLVVR